MEPGLLKSADWPLLIDLYFFLGGLAGGAFVIATIANLLDARRHRDIVRMGYYIAFLAILPGPLFLVVDLGLPTRFLNMLMVSKPSLEIGMSALTVGPFHLKLFSPMSAGAWALLGFSVLAFLAALDVFLEDRGGRSMSTLRVVVGVIGGFFAFFVAAYPGVLLGATARPLFISAHWLGALFLVVGASTGGAAIALILSLLGGQARDSLSRLMRFTAFALILQLAALVLFVVAVQMAGSTGIARAGAQLLSGSYSLTFWLGAVVIGIVAPLALQLGGGIKKAAPGMTALVSALILIGGFVVKYVITAAGQAT
ncbi:MAG: polysulfide reductase NrfD [Candidatus Rokubacteria bacterium]|nr:polysulfide reductase NrfD [Candidatus Rokubacteria bacterium]